MSWKSVPASELMAKKVGSVNPAKHPTEVFELFSIPAFDQGEPEMRQGTEIGSSKKCVAPNDVLLSRIVPHIRRCWVVPSKKDHRQIASGEWITFRSDIIFPDYLKHFLNSDLFHRQFMQTVSGVGGSLLRARPSEVERIEIPLPPLKEQKCIAAILDKADAIRSKRQQVIQLADQYLRSLFLEMFGDPIINPKRWPTVTFSEVAPSKPIRNVKVSSDENVWLLNLDQIESNSGAILSKLKCNIKEIGNSTSWFDERHVLYSKLRPYLNKVALPDGLGVATTELLPLEPEKNILIREYLASYLRSDSFVRWANGKVSGAKMPRLSTAELRSHLIGLPPIELQLEYVEVFHKVNKIKTIQESFLKQAYVGFNSISQKAFAGEL